MTSVRSFPLAVLMLSTAIAAHAQLSVLYNFGSAAGDPLNPGQGGVGGPFVFAQGRDGKVYSTSGMGGTNGTAGGGTVFDLTTTGSLQVLDNFSIEAEGPVSGLALGTDGNLYGSAWAYPGTPGGVLFNITPGGVFTVLYSFTCIGSDGCVPGSPPIQGTDGNLYGTTTAGGTGGTFGNNGIVYKLTPSGVLTTLYQFPCYNTGAGSSGCGPSALIQATDGNFYGTDEFGGPFGAGEVYKITPAGKFTSLYTFTGGTDGANPAAALIQGSDGNFYGTTCKGGNGVGGVYKITPGGNLTVLHSFAFNQTEGIFPYAGLVQATNGNLYGATSTGGTSTNCDFNGGLDCGTIFKVSTNGKFSVVYDFDSTTGANPYVTLVQHTNGTLYGATAHGGVQGLTPCSTGCGVFYSLNLGLAPFTSLFPYSGKVGKSIGFLGQGFTGTSAVSFSGTSASFRVVSDTYLTATVPSGATTGSVTVTTPGATLTSNKTFRVTPQLLSFSPGSGSAGTPVTITGVSLTQTSKVTFGGVAATTFTVNSDTQVTATVPTGAKTGKIVITTPGGTATSATNFVVPQ
jgi:uncharacterized repeat protein (TIGR03803 family)